jgi:hypothetical protein
MDIYIMTDDLEKCRKCGARTNFEDFMDNNEICQIHICPCCNYEYIVKEE